MATDKKYAIIGYGFVGKATEYFLKEKIEDNLEIYIEDPDLGYKVNNWAEIDYAFICVPTNLKNGKLDTSIIDKILSELYVGVQPIIRSTIGPDQAVQYANRGIIIMPEFLREKHWKEDVDNEHIDLLIGCYNCDPFVDLMSRGNKFVKQVTPVQASAIKMFRNAALAIKVGLANDFKSICEVYDTDYKVIQDYLEADANLGGTHWAVPGPDGQHGFGGTCLPKDLTHASSLCYNENNIMKTALEANKSRRDDE
tara:strand:+ start:1263 stop:2024 length:762 start_codon:yes stop_codon:yes gene_type:complete